jgi:NCS1 family nucleobase:cation symporter-1
VSSLAQAVSSNISLPSGIVHIYDMSYIYGLASAATVYFVLSHFFPAHDTLLEESVFDDVIIVGMEYRQGSDKASDKEGVTVSIASKREEALKEV